jgi:hypothetical protein
VCKLQDQENYLGQRCNTKQCGAYVNFQLSNNHTPANNKCRLWAHCFQCPSQTTAINRHQSTQQKQRLPVIPRPACLDWICLPSTGEHRLLPRTSFVMFIWPESEAPVSESRRHSLRCRLWRFCVRGEGNMYCILVKVACKCLIGKLHFCARASLGIGTSMSWPHRK